MTSLTGFRLDTAELTHQRQAVPVTLTRCGRSFSIQIHTRRFRPSGFLLPRASSVRQRPLIGRSVRRPVGYRHRK